MKKLLFTFVIAFAATTLQAQVCFEPKDSFNAGFGPGQITTGDFNGDLDIDIAVATTFGGSGIVRILFGNGFGGFAAAVNDTCGANPYGIHTADFDGDGDLDIATANSGSNDVSILLNNGAGNFAAAVNYAIGSNCRYITSAYLDADTMLDIVTCNFSSSDVSVLYGNVFGSFSGLTSFSVGASVWPHSVIAADFNEDGRMDLATANDGTNDVSILFGNGLGGFPVLVPFGTGASSSPTSVIAMDFNGDANLDLATANSGTNNVSVLLGDGAGSFSAAVIYPVSLSALYAITTADFDGDGNLDLAAAHQSGDSIYVLTGNGNGTFNASVNFWSGPSPYSIATADFNGDGAPDLATGPDGNQDATVLLNCNILDIENPAVSQTISVFPNPSNGIFNINLENLKGHGVIEIYDLMGKKVYSNTFIENQAIGKIDLSNYPKATYLITINNGEKMFTKKTIVE